MAILLTTSYQKISTISVTYGEIRTYARYTSQSAENNQTSYQLKQTYYVPTQTYVAFDSATGTLDGTQKRYTSTTRMYKGETTIQEISRTLNHNEDGSSPTKNVATSWTASFGGGGSTNADIVAPRIDRYPVITSAPNFNDEENPTITFTTTEIEGATIETAIFDYAGSTPLAPYREVNLSNGNYTFNLTTAERNALRNLTPNSNTIQVRFKLRTTLQNNTQYFSELVRTLTIINANPTYTSTKTENNQKVVTLLGSSSATSVIGGISNVTFTITPTALKGASISSVSLTHNNITYTKTTSPYTFTLDVVNGNFGLVITDSRNNQVTDTITLTNINYIPVNINDYSFARENPTSSNIFVNLEATYLQTTINSTANAPVIKWKLDDGSYTTIPSTEYSIDTTNNLVTITNYELTSALPYTSSGDFTIYIEDFLTSDSEIQGVMKGIATTEKGEHDFQVNGDLYVADTNRQNKKNILTEINNLKAVTLYTSTTGTQNDVTLNDSLANYSFIEIYFFQGNAYGSVKIDEPNGKEFAITFKNMYDNTHIHNLVKNYSASGTSLSVLRGAYSVDVTGSTPGVYSASTSIITIYKVVGYK